ncbi:hypothetical protein Tco_0263900, partial [Tanacetum coccineum]
YKFPYVQSIKFIDFILHGLKPAVFSSCRFEVFRFDFGQHGIVEAPQSILDWLSSGIMISPDDDASEVGSGENTLTNGSGSAAANGLTSAYCSPVTP